MSKAKLPPAVVRARRQLVRDAQRVCRLLREYAGKLHRLADDLYPLAETVRTGNRYVPLRRPVIEDEVLRTQLALALLRRRAVIAGMVEDTCRAASGLVEHGALSLAVKSELLLRLRETENALEEARAAAQHVQRVNARSVPEDLLRDVPVPDLAAIERRRKAARDGVDAQQPQPVG